MPSSDEPPGCLQPARRRPTRRPVPLHRAGLVTHRYTDAIVDYCETLRVFPERGRRRDDLRPGLRVTHYKKRAVIAFHVGKDVVTVLGVFYGGQAYEPVLGAKPPAATVPYQ